MGKKRETQDNEIFLNECKKLCYSRKISDRVQVGLPDNFLCYRGIMFGIEVKSVTSIPEDGMAPSGKGHKFSKKQIEELKAIMENGGIALGIIICGRTAFYFTPDLINEKGQVNCAELINQQRYLTKSSKNGWNVKGLIHLLWEIRIKTIWEAWKKK